MILEKVKYLPVKQLGTFNENLSFNQMYNALKKNLCYWQQLNWSEKSLHVVYQEVLCGPAFLEQNLQLQSHIEN